MYKETLCPVQAEEDKTYTVISSAALVFMMKTHHQHSGELQEIRKPRWAGACLTIGSWGETKPNKLWFAMFVDFPGIHTHTVSGFGLPTWRG